MLLSNAEGSRCVALTESRQQKLRVMIDEWKARRPSGGGRARARPRARLARARASPRARAAARCPSRPRRALHLARARRGERAQICASRLHVAHRQKRRHKTKPMEARDDWIDV